MLPLIGLIPLLPLLGFLVCGLFGRRLPRAGVSVIACGSVLLAFLVSVGAVVSLGYLEGEGSNLAGRPSATPDETGFWRGREAIAAASKAPATGTGTHPAAGVYEIAYWTWIPEIPFVEDGAETARENAETSTLQGEYTPGGAAPASMMTREEPTDMDTAAGSDAVAGTDSVAGQAATSLKQGQEVPADNRRVGSAPARGENESGFALAAARQARFLGGFGKPLRIDFGFRLDALSAIMILIITGVGFLIHVYSIGYMAHDPGYARYFAYLNLFTAMMLTLVLAGNFLVMFVGWEGVGLCSYLLIGFWYEDADKAQAGRKAFITNRIGDFAFILGLLAILVLFHTLDISTVMARIMLGGGTTGMLTLIALALFVGACGKSAQIPLYVWLPDAMAGPTPVSALIHAATMVTAGVYMVCRCSVLYVHAPAALGVVATIGAATALFAATIGVAQNDIKKVLAYSTVSQLGYMFLGAGVGAFGASVFHLMTHAFFKALLFLGAGSVIHAMSGEQDMRRMGGLRSRMPWTYATMLVGALAIAGFPLFSGFFSKDEILWRAWASGSIVLWAIGLLAAGLTAFYMFRLLFLTFHGSFRGTPEQAHHLHESPPSMTVPLAVLAVLALAGGWIGIPHVLGGPLGIPNLFESYLSPVLAHVSAEAGEGAAEVGTAFGGQRSQTELILMVLTTLVALGGIGAAWMIYRKPRVMPERAGTAATAGITGMAEWDHARARGSPVQRLLAHAYYVDELYDATVLKAYYRTCDAMQSFDRWIVDGLVNAIAAFTELIGQLLRLFQTGFVRNYALLLFMGAVALVWILAR